jgi:hypothetical protein
MLLTNRRRRQLDLVFSKERERLKGGHPLRTSNLGGGVTPSFFYSRKRRETKGEDYSRTWDRRVGLLFHPTAVQT